MTRVEQPTVDVLLIRRCFQSTLSRMYNLDLQVARRLQSCGTPVYRREEARGEKRTKRPMEERWRTRNPRGTRER